MRNVLKSIRKEIYLKLNNSEKSHRNIKWFFYLEASLFWFDFLYFEGIHSHNKGKDRKKVR